MTKKTLREVKSIVRNYFEGAKGQVLFGDDGEPVLYRGEPVTVGAYAPTMSGLACALGMTREELLGIENDGAIGREIVLARGMIEAYAEGALFRNGLSAGAKFALERNFPGWCDGGGQDAVSEDLSELSDEELDARIAALTGDRDES